MGERRLDHKPVEIDWDKMDIKLRPKFRVSLDDGTITIEGVTVTIDDVLHAIAAPFWAKRTDERDLVRLDDDLNPILDEAPDGREDRRR